MSGRRRNSGLRPSWWSCSSEVTMKSTACEKAVCEMSCSSPATCSLRHAAEPPSRTKTPRQCSNRVTVLKG